MNTHIDLQTAPQLDSLRTMHLLIAEDDQGARRILLRSLGMYCKHIHSAGDGDQAIALYEQYPIQVAVLDISMPGKTGLEVAAHIRNQDPDLPIIILTASEEQADLQAAVRLRLMEYIVKPIDMHKLRIALRLCLAELERRGRLKTILPSGAQWCSQTGCVVTHEGAEHFLTRNERSLLERFLRHRGQPLGSEALCQFPDGERLTPGSLRTLIYRLRTKVGTESILSLKDVGYLMPAEQGSQISE